MAQVLPVPDLSTEALETLARLAAGDAPSTAEEYLLWVRYESELLPLVIRAEGQNAKEEEETAPAIAELHKDAQQEDFSLPSQQWMNAVLANFSDLRQYLSYVGSLGVGAKSGPRVSVPAIKDIQGWQMFCFGSDATVDKEEGKNDEIITSNPNVQPSSFETQSYPTKTLPSTKLILQFDQVITRRLLETHINWLETTTLNSDRALWLYSLLARLEKPLTSDVAASIRQLYLRTNALRTLTVESQVHRERELQNDLIEEDGLIISEELKLVNLIGTIAGLYFEQDDGVLRNRDAIPDSCHLSRDDVAPSDDHLDPPLNSYPELDSALYAALSEEEGEDVL